MTIQEFKTSLKFILEDTNGDIKFSIKYKINEWISEITVSKYDGRYVVTPIFSKFDTIDQLVVFLLENVFNKKNIALAYRGLTVHNMIDRELDRYTDNELKVLVKQYNTEFFDIDYPFVKEGTL